MYKSLSIIIFILYIGLFLSSCSKSGDMEKDLIPDKKEISLKIDDLISLSENERLEITHLTVTGQISGAEWDLLFKMASFGNLEFLDMSNITIVGVPGKEDFWDDNAIPPYTFKGSKKIKKIILPYTLEVIGEEAFSDCTKLSSVIFPESLDSIASNAFHNAGLEGEFIMPQIRIMGKRAFGGTKISKVIISNNIKAAKESQQYTLYGNSAFRDCKNLVEVIVEEGVSDLEIGFSHCQSLSKVSLPSTLKHIGFLSRSSAHYIFNDCEALTEITLPDGLISIGYRAFYRTGLYSIKMPSTISSIDVFAFAECANLKEVELSPAIESIPQGCFKNCSQLQHITTTKKLRQIGYDAFGGCNNLVAFNFSSVSEIAELAFSNCNSLQSDLNLLTLTSLGKSAFKGCTSIASVKFDCIKTISESSFDGCISLSTLILGDYVVSIEPYAFFNCLALSTIELPSKLQKIGKSAFGYSGLKKLLLHCQAPPTTDSESPFIGINPNSVSLKIPKGSKHLYNSAPIWSDFTDVEEIL